MLKRLVGDSCPAALALLAVCQLLISPDVASAAGADASLAKQNCTFKAEANHVQIDANSGKVTGSTRFPSGQSVQVILEQKNPFKYRYRAEVTAAPLEESISKQFFSAFFP